MKSSYSQKGFTLIELIITIAILAVILTIVVVAINPAEQLQRSRDAKRVADLDSLRTAWNLYLAQAVETIDLAADDGDCIDGNPATYYISRATATSSGVDGTASSTATSTSQAIGATGWAPARIDQTPGGAAIPVLPVDPKGTGTTEEFWYAYACNAGSNTFEFTARLESTYFRDDLNIDGTDGGNSDTTYEVGNAPGLTLINDGY